MTEPAQELTDLCWAGEIAADLERRWRTDTTVGVRRDMEVRR